MIWSGSNLSDPRSLNTLLGSEISCVTCRRVEIFFNKQLYTCCPNNSQFKLNCEALSVLCWLHFSVMMRRQQCQISNATSDLFFVHICVYYFACLTLIALYKSLRDISCSTFQVIKKTNQPWHLNTPMPKTLNNGWKYHTRVMFPNYNEWQSRCTTWHTVKLTLHAHRHTHTQSFEGCRCWALFIGIRDEKNSWII